MVAAQTPGPGRPELPEIEPALLNRRFASAWRLFPDLQVGVVSLGSAAARDEVAEVLAGLSTDRVGVSATFVGLEGAPRGLRLARAALSSIPSGEARVASFDTSPLAGLVASAPTESGQLVSQVLGGLLDLPAGDRDTLLLTLRTWFDAEGATKATADRLFCHPNTVRHRLRRIESELGRSLTNPADLADLMTALRALDIFPPVP